MLSHTQYRHTYRHRHHNLHELAKGRRQEHKCVGKCAVSPVERITENYVAIDRGKPHLLWGMHAGAGHSISIVYHYTTGEGTHRSTQVLQCLSFFGGDS